MEKFIQRQADYAAMRYLIDQPVVRPKYEEYEATEKAVRGDGPFHERLVEQVALEHRAASLGALEHQRADLLADLIGEFPRRTQHQALQTRVLALQARQQCQAKCRCLATTGLCLRQHIVSCKHGR